MPHTFVPRGNLRGNHFFLNPDESRHLAVVLRKKPGEEVRLFDGENRSYRARLESVSPERVEGAILEELKASRIAYRLRLFQGMPKGDKLEWILEKGTELGVAEFIPIVTERSVVRVPPERIPTKLERWRKIILAAAGQCGRSDLPEVRAPVSFAEALALCGPGELTVLPWEGEETTALKAALSGKKGGTINLFIGPEGGFSIQEVEEARGRGAVTATLGPLILRTETAGIAAAAAVLYEMG
jgi:16S rRNA (uracil1498-N3)-methyltransferase